MDRALLVRFTYFLLLSSQKRVHTQVISMYMSFQLLCALMLALFHPWRIPLSQEMQHIMLLLRLHELLLLVPHHQFMC